MRAYVDTHGSEGGGADHAPDTASLHRCSVGGGEPEGCTTAIFAREHWSILAEVALNPWREQLVNGPLIRTALLGL